MFIVTIVFHAVQCAFCTYPFCSILYHSIRIRKVHFHHESTDASSNYILEKKPCDSSRIERAFLLCALLNALLIVRDCETLYYKFRK